MQSSLIASLGTLGATQVRFLYGLPFAAVFLGATAALAGASVPVPTRAFLAFAAGGSIAQIAGTALLHRDRHGARERHVLAEQSRRHTTVA